LYVYFLVFVFSFCMPTFLYSFVFQYQSSHGCEDRLQNDLYCVRWGVKLYSLTHLLYLCLLIVTDRAGDGRDVMASSAEEKPSLKVSVDDTVLPCASASDTEPILFDSNGSEDISFSQPLQDCKEDLMLLDTGDEASSLPVPCLIPELIVPSNSLLSQNDSQRISSVSGVAVDSNVDVRSASPVTDAADIPNGSIQKPVDSQPFDFVNDVMRSCSPNLSNKSASLPRLRSAAAAREDELTAAESDRLKS